MGKHKKWRKIAKRERRRKIRVKMAIAREYPFPPDSDEYKQWVEEQKSMELFELEQIERTNREENEKWLKAEQATMRKWQQLQKKIQKDHKKRLGDQEKKRLEMEEGTKKRKEEEERLKRIEEENRKLQQEFIEKLEKFLSGGSSEPPQELLVTRQTKPNCEPCPFFTKTGCCRFGDECSRNHQFCGISTTLLATNFFVHFGLENSNYNEYDTDLMLEYEDCDTYKDFKNFYYDVLSELEKFGEIAQFKVCHNFEKHLRGNTYIEYAEVRSAVAAYRALHGRWYAGKQVSMQFCHIASWRNAVCGLQSTKRCPKGRACNFLHVFRNPDRRFDRYNSRATTPKRAWRWSESPEIDVERTRSRRSSSESKRSSERNNRRETHSERSERDRRKSIKLDDYKNVVPRRHRPMYRSWKFVSRHSKISIEKTKDTGVKTPNLKKDEPSTKLSKINEASHSNANKATCAKTPNLRRDEPNTKLSKINETSHSNANKATCSKTPNLRRDEPSTKLNKINEASHSNANKATCSKTPNSRRDEPSAKLMKINEASHSNANKATCAKTPKLRRDEPSTELIKINEASHANDNKNNCTKSIDIVNGHSSGELSEVASDKTVSDKNAEQDKIIN